MNTNSLRRARPFARIWFGALMLIAADRAAAQMVWSVESPANRPNGRFSHRIVYDTARSRVVLFGGNSLFSGLAGDTWEWDGTDWTDRSPAAGPSPRAGHGMAYDVARRRVVLFGGNDASSTLDDTWEWDGTVWVERFPAHRPPARDRTVLAYDVGRGRTVLFGGYDGAASLSDTWEWDGADWVERQPPTIPPPSSGHAVAYDIARRHVLMVRGHPVETWTWDGNDWTRHTPATAPDAIGSMVYDAARERIVLHVPWTYPVGTTWEWDGQEWFTTVSGFPNPSPSGRDSTQLTYDVARGRTVAFGGWKFHAALVFNDTWRYGPTRVGRVAQIGTGCPGASGVPLAAAVGPPIVGNREFAVQLAPVPANAPVAVGLAALPARRLLAGGCVLYVEPPLLALTGVSSAAGLARVTVAVPRDASLSGVEVFAQGFVADAGGAYFGVAAFTQGLSVSIGD